VVIAPFIAAVVVHALGASLSVPQGSGTEQLRTLCPNPSAGNGDALLHEEVVAGDRAPRHGAGSAAWTALGCVRVQLALAGVPPREGTRMVLGSHWEDGAINAMVEAVRLEPTNKPAARVLAILALEQPQPQNVRAIVADFAAALHAGDNAAEMLDACDELALRVNQDALSRECAIRGLATGTDSTWHLLHLARLDYRVADSAAGSAAFLLAGASARSTEDVAALEWQLQWFATPTQVQQWITLRNSDRGAWLRSIIAERDVRDGRPAGTRIAEHFARLEYVLAHFTMHFPKQVAARARVGGTGLALMTVDAYNPTGGMSASASAPYRRWQLDIDDRGIVWMRLGKPAARYYWGYNFRRETWTYDIDGVRHLLNFQDEDFNGNRDATRLVVGVEDPFFCGIDPLRCEASSYLGPAGPAALMSAIHEQDAQSVVMGTARDDNSARAARPIGIVAQLQRLWDPVSGAPAAIFSYSMPLDDLPVPADSANAATVQMALRRWDAAQGVEADTTFTLQVARPAATAAGASTVHAIALSQRDGVRTWSLRAAVSDSSFGKAWGVADSTLDTGPVALSDLVLGSRRQGVAAHLGGRDIALAPLGAFSRSDLVELYYQIHSDRDVDQVETTLNLARMFGGNRPDSVVLSIRADGGVVHRGINEVERALDVTKLPPGAYHVVVTVSGRSLAGDLVPYRRRAVLLLY
jgi:ketosteroid isomerase-like protein